MEKSLKSIAINFGLYLGGLMIVIAILMYVTDMAFKGQQWPVTIYYIAFPVAIIYAIYLFKTNNKGVLTLKDALKIGVLVAIISALTYVLYILILNYIIDTEYNDRMMEFATEQIASSGAPVEAKEAQLKMVEFFSSPLMGSVVWVASSMFFGLIYALIGGLIMKNNPNAN